MSSAPPSSTPTRADDAIFSDDINRQRESSPPSSPPGYPWELQKRPQSQTTTTPKLPSSPPRKNAFSILGKRKALDAISDNARTVKQQKSGESKSSKSLTQMQMSLGQEVQKKCKQCGMEYVASSAEDRKLHDKFHKQNTEGYDVGKAFISKTDRTAHRLFKGVKEGDVIALVDYQDNHHRKKRAQAVLDIVQRELGAVPIPESDIWDENKPNRSETRPGNDEVRYRSFLYIRGTKCVGFLLVQQIQEAFRVDRPRDAPVNQRPKKLGSLTNKNALEALQARKDAAAEAKAALAQTILEADQQPIRLSSAKSPAKLGISRIWSSPTHRGEGIARKLMDTAIGQHNLRISNDKQQSKDSKDTEKGEKQGSTANSVGTRRIERKEQVAFSQPTEAGARLARRWFGRPYGWSVYID